MINKIYNEDCLVGLKSIPDNFIDLVIIDPPYDICTKGGKKGNTRIANNIKLLEKELIDNNLVNAFDYSVLDELVRVMKNINIYIFCNGRQIPKYLKYFVDKLECKFDILIWVKSNPMPLYSNKYLGDKEYCLYFRKNGYCQPNNYEDARTVYISSSNIKDKKLYEHPTIKPVELIRKLIRNSSKENDIVLDCFLGSGTTACASILEKRNYIGYEINKKYYDIANKRINETKESDS
jgi:site-specific DNA-methyltransferase (adenine-specific)